MGHDALRPTRADAEGAWRLRVCANREQVEQFREAQLEDFYAPIAGMFRADPRRVEDPALGALLTLVEPSDTVLDIGAGGGRYALPVALHCREVIAVDPSETMLGVLTSAMREHQIQNIQVVHGRWPACADAVQGEVALISHLGYDVEDIGPFLDGMESAARRLCVGILLTQPPPTEADRFWPLVHGVERAALPSLPEFLTLLTARGRLFEVHLVDRSPQTYATAEQATAFLRQQLWTARGSEKDQTLERLALERLTERDGRYALNWTPVPMGVITWSSPRAGSRARR